MADPTKDPDFSQVNAGASSDASSAPAGTYTVVRGDTLSGIAKRFYGDAGLWPLIQEANADLIRDPDRIQAGWVLAIPPKP